VVDAAWLERQGYSTSLRSHYVKAGWLDQPTRRVYRRSRGPLEWEQVVISLQVLMDYPLTVGGRNALEAQGYAHYLPTHIKEVHLYGPERPPSWLDDLPLDVQFVWHNSLRLFPTDPPPDREAHATKNPGENGPPLMPGGYMVRTGGMVTWPLRYSRVERAVLELMDELPDHESFHQVDALMEGLVNIRPDAMQTLLRGCASIKVKRLFFFFADRHRHAWRAKLDKDAIDLGSGKRVLAKGGKLDPNYLITVPRDLDGLS